LRPQQIDVTFGGEPALSFIFAKTEPIPAGFVALPQILKFAKQKGGLDA
jgi:hypothetical protein